MISYAKLYPNVCHYDLLFLLPPHTPVPFDRCLLTGDYSNQAANQSG